MKKDRKNTATGCNTEGAKDRGSKGKKKNHLLKNGGIVAAGSVLTIIGFCVIPRFQNKISNKIYQMMK